MLDFIVSIVNWKKVGDMTPIPNNSEQKIASIYEIRIKNCIDLDWSNWFEDLEILQEQDGTTLLIGPISDQSALYGLLKLVHQLGLQLISVNKIKDTKIDTSKKGDEINNYL